MTYNPESSIPIRDMQHWSAEDPAGDLVLYDIFTSQGEPLQRLHPDEPPKPFRHHSTLEEGFDILAESENVLPGLFIATVYTDAAKPADLGMGDEERSDVASYIGAADLVLYGLRRSIVRGRQEGIASDQVGRLWAPDGKLYQADYLDNLQDMARPGTPTFCYDYATGGPDATTLSEALGTVAGQVERACDAAIGPLDEDPYALVADLQCTNARQWHTVGEIGRTVYELLYDQDSDHRKVAIVAPAEDSDLLRKLHVSGVHGDDLAALFVRPDMTNNSALRYDAEILARGYIPAGFGPFPTR